MRKTKLLYMSLALGAACVGLASCGSKGGSTDNSGNETVGDVSLNLDRDHYKSSYTSTSGSITFYNVEYETSKSTASGYIEDENGNYYLKDVLLGSVRMEAGTPIDYLPTPTRKGYNFAGWYVENKLASEFYYTQMPESANLVAYARWELDQDTIYVAPNENASAFNSGKRADKAMTLFEASRVYKPGATIVLAEGTYSLKDTLVFGNGGDKDHITKIQGNNSILDFSSMTEDDANQGIKITGNYNEFTDLTVSGAGDNGVLLGSSNNLVSNCTFTKNHDTGLQIARYNASIQPYLDQWPSNNLVLNCTSYNNCDDAGEDADGFAAKLTVGNGNVFDGCLAYWNVDDGWDLYAKADTGRIGTVTIRNSASFQNGRHLLADGSKLDEEFKGDGNGFKLGGSVIAGEVIVDNCVAAYNYAHGFTDNSNPGTISISNCTSINNGEFGDKAYDNFNLNRDGITANKNYYSGLVSYYTSTSKNKSSEPTDEFNGSINDSIFYQSNTAYKATGPVSAQSGESFLGSKNVKNYTYTSGTVDSTNPSSLIPTLGINWHKKLRNADNSLNLGTRWAVNTSKLGLTAGAVLNKTSDTYTHTEELAIDTSASNDDEIVRNAYNSLNLAVNSNYIYNNVYLPTSISGATISWASSNTNVVSISTTEVDEKNLGQKHTYAILANRVDNDTTVKLTATISSNGVTKTKEFNITVQGLDPRIGKIQGLDSVTILDNAELPSLTSYSVYDYVSTGLVLEAGKDYQVSYAISYSNEYYADPSTGAYSSGTYSNTPGTYKIVYTFKVDGYADVVVNRYITVVNHEDTYDILAAKTALGYIIDNTIDLSVNASYYAGTAYAVALNNALTDEQLNSSTVAASIVDGTIENKVSDVVNANITSRDFAMSISLNSDYVDETSAYVYLVVVNENGIGSIFATGEIKPTELISNAEQLKDAITNKDNIKKAYKLVANIDCENANWTQDGNSVAFEGYFDGAGHTISNLVVTVSGTDGGGLFFKLSNQAIVKNFQLEHVYVYENEEEAKSDLGTSYGKVGIVTGEIQAGATIENISILNCGASAYQRVGGVAGQLSGSKNKSSNTVIRNIVVYNTETQNIKNTISAVYISKDANGNETKIGGKYVAGILAHYQYSGSSEYATTLTIENCYVNTSIQTANQYSAGILGRVDPKYSGNVITISNCVFAGKLTSSSSYTAGILGGRSSGPTITINNTVVTGSVSGSSSGMTVSQNLCNKETVGTDKIYRINEDYVTLNNCYYGIANYIDPSESGYATADEYYAAMTKNKEYYGIATYYNDLTKEFYESIGFDFTNVFEYNNGGFTLKLFNKM